jgi:hypothetical protein
MGYTYLGMGPLVSWALGRRTRRTSSATALMMIEGLRGAWANKCIPEAASALDWIATPPPLSENLHNSRRQAQAANS